MNDNRQRAYSNLAPSPASSFLSSFSAPILPPSSSQPSLRAHPDEAFPVFANKAIGRLLGKGSTGSVREVLSHPSKERLHPPQAVKIVLVPKPPPDGLPHVDRSELTQEIELWRSLPAHPNILPLLSAEHAQSTVYLFMPYMVSGSLFDLVKRHREHDRGRGRRVVSSFRQFHHLQTATPAAEGGVGRAATVRENGVGGGLRFFPEDEARRLFRDVVAGLEVLHKEGIVHGDLKCENVLVDEEGHCKLSDFGFSHRLEQSIPPEGMPSFPPNKGPQPRQASSPFPLSATLLLSPYPAPFIPPSGGSMPYTAPELLLPSPSHQIQPSTTLASDVWALGVLLHFLITTGEFPFQDAFEPRLQLKIQRGVWSVPEEVGGRRLGREIEGLLRGMLDVEKGERWAVGDVRECEWVMGWGEVRRASKSRSRSRTRLVGSGAARRRSTSTKRGEEVIESMSVGSTEFPLTPAHSLSPPTKERPRGRSFREDDGWRAARPVIHELDEGDTERRRPG